MDHVAASTDQTAAVSAASAAGHEKGSGPFFRTSRSSGNVRQPDHVRDDQIARDEAEPRPGSCEERLAVTEYDGMDVEPILVHEAEVTQASRQLRSGDFDFPGELRLQSPYRRLDVIREQRGVQTD